MKRVFKQEDIKAAAKVTWENFHEDQIADYKSANTLSKIALGHVEAPALFDSVSDMIPELSLEKYQDLMINICKLLGEVE